jgi:hypothetical protein|tara:strand:+ start:14609 stop:14971 length:363 start_codon:yes stop_codon:yes gene_type:complete
MPPRFVEIATPLEDGVEWAGSAGNAFAAFVAGLVESVPVPSNITDRVYDQFNTVCSSLEEYDTFASVRGAVADVPKPHGISAYMLMAAVATALMRVVFVRAQASRILKMYGQSRDVCKDL